MQQELTLEQQRDQKLEVLKGYYQAALNMAKQNGEDTAQLEKAYKDVQTQIQKEYITKQKEQLDEQDEKKKQARQALGFDQQSEYDRHLQQLKQALDNQYITQQEYEQKVQFDLANPGVTDVVKTDANRAKLQAKIDHDSGADRTEKVGGRSM